MGIGVAADRVRAVGVAGDTVRWAVELERSEGEALAETLAALLARCPARRWPRARVAVAVGPSAVQVKRLTGLPPLQDRAALASLVREGAGRFFLRNGTPLLTTDVSLVETGTAWAAAFESPVVEQVERACREAALRLRVIAPTAVALGRAVNGAEVVWEDGDVRTVLGFTAGKIATARRVSNRGEGAQHGCGSAIGVPTVAALAVLGERAFAFADAYGATRLSRDEPLAIHTGSASLSPAPSRARLFMAMAAFAMAAIGALVVPSLDRKSVV